MRFLRHFIFAASALAVLAAAAAVSGSSHQACQAPTQNPLDGCPPGTLLVSATNPQAGFKTIQSAINSLRPDVDATILILAGKYTEQVNVTRAGALTLLGQTNACLDATKNQVTVIQARAQVSNLYPDNVYTSTLIVGSTLYSTYTGAGPTGFPVPADTHFGCRDFRAYNIDFQNNYREYTAGPSQALSFSYANGGFYFCGFYSYQDTVYVGKLGNAYFYKSIIAGQTDFIYGFGTAWIQSCTLLLRGCGGGITAWKGAQTSFQNKYGVYIADSTVQAANATIAPHIVGKCALGRPWNSYHRSIFARTYEDASILPAGYEKWRSPITKDTLMAEYKPTGPGFNQAARLSGGTTTELTDVTYEPYNSPSKVFTTESGVPGNIGWIDQNYYGYS